VKQTYPFLLSGERMSGDRSWNDDAVRKNAGSALTLDQESGQRILSMPSPKPNESLDDMLTSALLVQDKELAGIVSEVDELLRTIKADTPESQAVSNALLRTVLCAVKQSLLDRELRSLALTDDLTRLFNRRAFVAMAAQQTRITCRKCEGLLLFLADVDGLKDINDSYGHREGDLALIRTADAMERAFRDSDILARLGGDEFAALALDASNQSEDIILRRLEESLRISNRDDSRYRLSLSVGVARLDPDHLVSVGELLEQADRAMYAVKKKRTFTRT